MNKTIDDKLREGRTYRDMEMRIADQAEDSYIIEGYATTFDQPYKLGEKNGVKVYEQVARSAFDDADMDDVIMQYDHEGRVFARRSNGTLQLEADDHGLKVTADLGGTQIGRQLYEEIKGGYTTKMSFGFTVGHSSRRNIEADDGEKSVLRTIDTINKLYDVSAVSLPANNATEISARADSDGVVAEVLEELEMEQRQRAEREKLILSIKILTEV